MPRDYGKISHRFWTGETGRQIRSLGLEARVVATYLVTCGSSNMIGLYYLPVMLISHETGVPFEGASKALRSLSEAGFAHYDEANEVVFVPRMARQQIAEKLSASDRQQHGVVAILREYRKSKFVADFVALYGESYHLPEGLVDEAPSKALASPIEGPSKPRAGSGAGEQEQEQEQDSCAEPAVAAPAPVPEVPALLVFGCSGEPDSWGLTQQHVDEWTAAYRAVDVLSEARKALAWINANPTKRKTSRGMAKFLVGWMSRCQDRGGSSAPLPLMNQIRGHFSATSEKPKQTGRIALP
jgi:hypothetical protein